MLEPPSTCSKSLSRQLAANLFLVVFTRVPLSRKLGRFLPLCRGVALKCAIQHFSTPPQPAQTHMKRHACYLQPFWANTSEKVSTDRLLSQGWFLRVENAGPVWANSVPVTTGFRDNGPWFSVAATAATNSKRINGKVTHRLTSLSPVAAPRSTNINNAWLCFDFHCWSQQQRGLGGVTWPGIAALNGNSANLLPGWNKNMKMNDFKILHHIVPINLVTSV